MSAAAQPSPEAEIARSIVDSLPVTPGMTAAIGAGTLDDALAAELRRRGVASVGGGEPVDVAFVTAGGSAALEGALSRCRDRGLVVVVGDGPLERLDLYPDVHSRGLRLAFRASDEGPVAGELP